MVTFVNIFNKTRLLATSVVWPNIFVRFLFLRDPFGHKGHGGGTKDTTLLQALMSNVSADKDQRIIL